uniref:BZIP domain-containing protein n=1 Tax=Mycena chlorophos TaxID=658473 RepID=A0ABQ0MCT8_MYCCL|nr:predicted protein [Mycena chlorophos]
MSLHGGVKPRWTSSALFGNCNGPELRSKAPSRLPFAPAWPPPPVTRPSLQTPLTQASTAEAFTTDDAVASSPPARFDGSPQRLASKSLRIAAPRAHAMLSDYDEKKNNYLAMISSSQEDKAKQIERLAASPEVQSLVDDFFNDSAYAAEPLIEADDYLPSPHMQKDYDLPGDNLNASPLDTPYSAFLSTPLMGIEGDEFDPPVMTRAVEDALAGELFAFTDDGEDVVPVGVKLPLPASGKLDAFTPTSPMLDDFDSTLTNPAASFPNTPVIPPPSPSSPLPVRRQPARKTRVVAGANGTRKNITPAHLIPLDAPIQHRTYRLPSATSRKAVPASSRKRTRSAAFADDEGYDDDDDDGDYALHSTRRAGRGVSAGEAQCILDKRRQNTLAARKSRRRKLEHVQELESTVVELRGLVTRWRERARMAQGMLREKGTMVDFAED